MQRAHIFVLLIITGVFILPFSYINQGRASSPSSSSRPREPEPPLNLQRRLLVGVQIQNPPFSMQNADGTWSGITVDLWNEIAKQLGLEFDFKPSDLKSELKDLANGKIDAVAAGLGVTAEREELFDFSTPYLVANEAIAVAADQHPSYLQLFARAFFNSGIFVLFVFSLAIIVLGALILWLLEMRGNGEHYGGRSRTAFARSLFWSIMVLGGRDLPESIGWKTNSPTTRAARIFGIVWMIVGIVFVSLFTATAASVLTSKQLQSVVNDPQDLHHVRVGTVPKSVGQTFLDHEHIKYALYGPGPVDLLKALTDHKIDAAVYNGPIMGYYAKTQFSNKVVVLRFSLRQDFMAIPLPQNSPLRRPLNRVLLQIIDSKSWQTRIADYLGE